jgi:thiol:disulfide interchange protein DsbC
MSAELWFMFSARFLMAGFFSLLVLFLQVVQAATVPLIMQSAENVSTDTIMQAMQKAFPGVHVSDIQSSPVPNIVEAVVNGSDRVYLTLDGRFMFVGNLYQLDASGGPVNLTEQRLAGVRKVALKEVKADDMITFPAVGKQKAQVYVFTDVTCPFCRQFHKGIGAINKLGITVHYLAFPRAGLGTKVAEDMGKVWCAKDPQAALTAAKLGKFDAERVAERKGCLSPVADEYNLGQKLGLQGTPTIYTVDGRELGGYLSPEQLASKLGLKKGG